MLFGISLLFGISVLFGNSMDPPYNVVKIPHLTEFIGI